MADRSVIDHCLLIEQTPKSRYFFSADKNCITFVPQVAQVPFNAGLPFLGVTFCAFFISYLLLHFTQ